MHHPQHKNSVFRPVVLRFLLPAVMLFVSAFPAATPCSAGAYEQELLDRINAYRAGRKLAPLTRASRLDELAREHSRTMRTEESLSHNGFEGRFERSGASACVENVGWNHKTPASQFRGWKESAGHNRNMLSRDVSGAGIAKDGAYVTFFACK